MSFKNYRLNLVGRSIYAEQNDSFEEVSAPNRYELITAFNTGFYRIETGISDGQPYTIVVKDLEIFSGFKTSADFHIGKRFVQDTLNIGRTNITTNDNAANTIGYINTLSGINYSTYIMGTQNKLNNSNESLIFGNINYINNSIESISIGNNNVINSSLWNTTNIGHNNIISGKNNGSIQDTYVFGWGNYVSQSTGVKIFGDTNTSINIDDANILGENNDLNNSADVHIFGNNLDVNSSQKISAIGINNNITNSFNISVFGEENDIISSTGVYGIGENNLLEQTDLTYIFGRSNEIINCHEGSIFGQDNINSNSNLVHLLGTSNEIYDVNESRIFGDYNAVRGGIKDSTLIGSSNQGTGDSVDYQISIIGYGNDFSNLKRVHVVGNSNLIHSGLYNHIVGYSNDIAQTNYTTVIGNENICIAANDSYVLGKRNEVSGNKTLVIGNNNSIRTGDYNSVFVGINYEPTGNAKIAKVILGCVESTVEVDPYTISLNSVNTPTVNGKAIVLQDQFDTLNGALISPNKLNFNATPFAPFQDPSYQGLPEKIQFTSFSWNSGTIDGTFNTEILESVNILTLDNFSVFGATSYVSTGQGFNVIYGTDKNLTNDPAWMIVDNASGIYQINKNNFSNSLPQTGWMMTGFAGSEGTSDVQAKLVMGTRTGLAPVTFNYKTVYFPYYY